MINGNAVNSFAVNSAGGGPSLNVSILENLTVDEVLIGDIPAVISELLEIVQEAYGYDTLYLDTLLEDLDIVQTEVVIRLIVLLESLNMSSSLVTDVIWGLGEDIGAVDTLSSNATVGNILNSSITVDDVIRLIFEGSILENLEVTLSESIYTATLDQIVDVINSTDSVSSKLTALSSIALTLTVTDAILFGSLASITENIDVTHSSIDTVTWLHQLIDALTVTLSSSDYLVLVGTVDDTFTLDDTLSYTQQLFNTILENMTMVVLGDDGDTYSGWVLNPETFAIWNYDNHNFNSMATLNGVTFFANSSGLYKMGGTLDDTAFIRSRLKTAAIDFGTSNLKQVPDMYIGMSLTGEMVIGVTTDERINVKYKLTTPSTVQELQSVKLGKGLRGNLWQFELIDDKATALEISSIEWVPIVFGRKRR